METTTLTYWSSFWSQMNIANWISLSRAAGGLSIPLWWNFSTEFMIIMVFFMAISDAVDGWWARSTNTVTPLGAIMDPIADKLFVNPCLFMVAYSSDFVWLWALLVVNLLYDIDNTYQRRKEIHSAILDQPAESSLPASTLSKTKTAVMFILIFAAIVPAQYMVYEVIPILTGVLLGMVGLSWIINRLGSSQL